MKKFDYHVLVICFERDATYSHSNKVKKSEVYDIIENWSRERGGICELIDMRRIAQDIKNGKIRKYSHI